MANNQDDSIFSPFYTLINSVDLASVEFHICLRAFFCGIYPAVWHQFWHPSLIKHIEEKVESSIHKIEKYRTLSSKELAEATDLKNEYLKRFESYSKITYLCMDFFIKAVITATVASSQQTAVVVVTSIIFESALNVFRCQNKTLPHEVFKTENALISHTLLLTSNLSKKSDHVLFLSMLALVTGALITTCFFADKQHRRGKLITQEAILPVLNSVLGPSEFQPHIKRVNVRPV